MDRAGDPVEGKVHVNLTTENAQLQSHLAGLKDGGYAVFLGDGSITPERGQLRLFEPAADPATSQPAADLATTAAPVPEAAAPLDKLPVAPELARSRRLSPAPSPARAAWRGRRSARP